MKKTFSLRNANIETIIVVDYEINNDGELFTKTNCRVVKHGMGRSRTIMNNETWEQARELMFKTNLQVIEWMLNKNNKENNNESKEVSHTRIA